MTRRRRAGLPDVTDTGRATLADVSGVENSPEVTIDAARFPSSAAKRHHYVPAFLIARFGEPPGQRGGHVVQMDKTTGRPSRMRVDNVGFIKHYYTLIDGEGARDTSPEAVLAAIEGDGAVAVARLVETGTVSDDERGAIALLLAFQSLRTPHGQGRLMDQVHGSLVGFLRFIAGHPEAHRATWELMDPVERGDDAESDRLELARLLADDKASIKVNPHYAIVLMLYVAPDLAGDIVDYSWTLLRAPAGDSFVCADTPLTHTDPMPPATPWSGDGWATSHLASTTMPLDPQACLLIRPAGPDFEVREADKRTGEDVNLRTYGWAERWVWAKKQQTLQNLRSLAKRRPERVGKPRIGATVTLREGDPKNPEFPRGGEHGWPRGLWQRNADGPAIYHDYEVMPNTGKRRKR